MKERNIGGLGLTGTLTIIFIVLKLTGLIEWPWIWVVSPLWIGFLFILMLVVLLVTLRP